MFIRWLALFLMVATYIANRDEYNSWPLAIFGQLSTVAAQFFCLSGILHIRLLVDKQAIGRLHYGIS